MQDKLYDVVAEDIVDFIVEHFNYYGTLERIRVTGAYPNGLVFTIGAGGRNEVHRIDGSTEAMKAFCLILAQCSATSGASSVMEIDVRYFVGVDLRISLLCQTEYPDGTILLNGAGDGVLLRRVQYNAALEN